MPKRLAGRLVLFAAGALVGAGACLAQVIAPVGISYEDAGVLAGSCFNCHGTDGQAPAGPMPSIAGMAADEMIARLAAFRTDQVPGATIMGRIALGFSDEQIRALALYFAGESWP